MKRIAALLAALVLPGVAVAGSSSASFEIKAFDFNAGGHPPYSTSVSFNVKLGALGDGAAALPITSASFGIDGGFSASFPTPGEVTDVVFTDGVTFTWHPERAATAYNIYREALTGMTPDFGACEQSDLASETATDNDVPDSGTGFFYLVTATNCLDEEGTKGFQSNGIERANSAPCP